MIKLNLLPQYVIELRKIRTVIITFVVLLGIEGGVVFKVYSDLKSQEAWFIKDKPYYEQRTQLIAGEKSKADGIKTKSEAYGKYIEFFTRQPMQKYVEDTTKVIQDAAAKVGGTPHAWFDDMTITGSTVAMNGKIKGLMDFVHFYFKMKKASLKVEPRANPAPSPQKPLMGQTVDLVVSGTLGSGLPEPPKAPEPPTLPGDLYHPAGATAPAAGAATGARAPAPAPAPAPAK